VNRYYFLVAVLTVAGCAKPVKSDLISAPVPALQSGWTQRDTRGALTLAAPSDWILSRNHVSTLGLSVQDLQGSLATANQNATSDSQSPAAAPAAPPDTVDDSDLENQNSKSEVLVLYSKNVKPIPGEEMTRMYVKKVSVSGTADAMAKHFAGDMNGTATKISLPIGSAQTWKGDTTTRGGDVISDIGYLIVNGDEAYEFVFETSNHEGNIDQVADSIMQTVRLKPAK
jgi:hypothetical protein